MKIISKAGTMIRLVRKKPFLFFNSISGQSDEDPPHFQDGPTFCWAAESAVHIARGVEGAGDHHACGHHHLSFLYQNSHHYDFQIRSSSPCSSSPAFSLLLNKPDQLQSLGEPNTDLYLWPKGWLRRSANFVCIQPYSGSRLFYDCIMWSLLTLSTVGYHLQPQVLAINALWGNPFRNLELRILPISLFAQLCNASMKIYKVSKC